MKEAHRHMTDRTGEDIFSWAQAERIRENMDRHISLSESPATKKTKADYSTISETNIKDLMTVIASHAGRIDVAGFGTFSIREIPGKVFTRNGKQCWRPPFRRVEFRQSPLLRDMVNLDHENQQVAEPNPEFFKGSRNLRVL